MHGAHRSERDAVQDLASFAGRSQSSQRSIGTRADGARASVAIGAAASTARGVATFTSHASKQRSTVVSVAAAASPRRAGGLASPAATLSVVPGRPRPVAAGSACGGGASVTADVHRRLYRSALGPLPAAVTSKVGAAGAMLATAPALARPRPAATASPAGASFLQRLHSHRGAPHDGHGPLSAHRGQLPHCSALAEQAGLLQRQREGGSRMLAHRPQPPPLPQQPLQQRAQPPQSALLPAQPTPPQSAATCDLPPQLVGRPASTQCSASCSVERLACTAGGLARSASGSGGLPCADCKCEAGGPGAAASTPVARQPSFVIGTQPQAWLDEAAAAVAGEPPAGPDAASLLALRRAASNHRAAAAFLAAGPLLHGRTGSSGSSIAGREGMPAAAIEPAAAGLCGSGVACHVSRAACAPACFDDAHSDSSDVSEASTSLRHDSGCSSSSSSGGGGGGGSGSSSRDSSPRSSRGALACRQPALGCAAAQARPAALGAPVASGRGVSCGLAGLLNLGNTCFLNAVLQCLASLPELAAALVPGGSVCWRPRAAVGPALCELLDAMRSRGAPAAIGPRRLLRALCSVDERWGSGEQQDAMELLHCLLQQLQAECNRVPRRPPYRQLSGAGSEAQQAADAESLARAWSDSTVDDLFGGLLHSRSLCGACGAQTHAFDPCLDLALALPVAQRRGATVGVEDCLAAFCAPETMAGAEQLACAVCRCRRDGSKALRVFRHPRLLVLQLKRFAGSGRASGGGGGVGGGGGGGFHTLSKTTTPLRLQGCATLGLNLAPCCSPVGLAAAAAAGLPPPRYELAALVQHHGSLEGGHYTALACAPGGQWHAFDDERVTPLRGPPAGESAAPYILFFRLRDAPERAAPPRAAPP